MNLVFGIRVKNRNLMNYSIQYPRRVIIRNSIRFLVRGLFPLISKTSISGLEKFPKNGPLIVIGNHTGVMEVALMGTYSPRALEFFGAMEMPWGAGWARSSTCMV